MMAESPKGELQSRMTNDPVNNHIFNSVVLDGPLTTRLAAKYRKRKNDKYNRPEVLLLSQKCKSQLSYHDLLCMVPFSTVCSHQDACILVHATSVQFYLPAPLSHSCVVSCHPTHHARGRYRTPQTELGLLEKSAYFILCVICMAHSSIFACMKTRA